MSEIRAISELSRQELFELIWATPAPKLEATFGISNVAIAKRCKRLGIPRPSRRYWAKVEAGKQPHKPELPPPADQVFKKEARQRLPKLLSLPEEGQALCPLAAELEAAITKAKLDQYKRAHLSNPLFPEVTVSKTLAGRTMRAFHVLLAHILPLGIRFQKSRSSYGVAYFDMCKDRLYLSISEDLVRRDGSKFLSQNSWTREKAIPSGRLAFVLKPDEYSRESKIWSEAAKVPLEKVLRHVVSAVRDHYLEVRERRQKEREEAERRHAEWLIRTKEWERQEAIRKEEERLCKHAAALAAVVAGRHAALLQAADKWQESNNLFEFISACEANWRSSEHDLTAEQAAWLKWARHIASSLSPFSVGYPAPLADGAFDQSLIPVGGPYPPVQSFEDQEL